MSHTADLPVRWQLKRLFSAKPAKTGSLADYSANQNQAKKTMPVCICLKQTAGLSLLKFAFLFKFFLYNTDSIMQIILFLSLLFTPLLAAGVNKEECVNRGQVLQRDENVCGSLLEFKPLTTPWLKHYPLIQAEVDRLIETQKADVLASAQSLFSEFPYTALLPFQVHINELTLFEHNRKAIISVRLAIRIYTGGAHGNTRHHSWNLNQKTQKFLSIDEAVGADRVETLMMQARNTLFSKIVSESDKEGRVNAARKKWIELGTAEKSDFRVWNFNKNGILVLFEEYQVTAYSYGSFEVFLADF